MSIFKENLTSKILQDTSSKIINKSKKKLNILEIGCGNGNITNYIIKNSHRNHSFFLSDISKKAVAKAKKLIQYKNCSFKVGKWLNPWKKNKFDLIISDVSSINDLIASRSDWYKGVVCNSGLDGLKNINKILSSIENNLKINGTFILPIISLSNEKKLIKSLKNKFCKVTLTKKVEWPLPKFFYKKIREYEKLKAKNQINYYDKFGVKVAYTYSAVCKKIDN